MRLLNFRVKPAAGGQAPGAQSDGCRVGAWTPAGIVDLTALHPLAPREVVELLAAGAPALAAAAECIDRAQQHLSEAQLQLLPPVRRPGKFLGVGGNFHSHIAEAARLGAKTPAHPIWFNKQVGCVNGPHDPIWAPFDSGELDYEAELALVIGRRCRRVPVEEAMGVVAGFMVCNDVSIRDWQMRAPTATAGKSFDTHGPIGPWLVTPDEVADPGRLRIRTWVNGALRQDGWTDEMVFDCATLVADASRMCTLEVGDILTLGSPAGVGGLMEPPQWLHPGDVVRVEIDGIGAIENPVIAEPRD